MDSDLSKEVERLHCNKCLRHTNHAVLWKQDFPWSEDLDEGRHWIEGADSFRVVQCQGCDAVMMEHAHWFSEEMDADGRPITHREFYPPTVTRHPPAWRREIHLWSKHLEENIFPLLNEINAAYRYGSFRIAAMGLRTLVETIMTDQVGRHDNFATAIDSFFAKGFVAERQQDQFKSVLVEAGHAATHRGYSPTREDIDFLLDVTEGLIDEVYFRPARAKKVRDRIPSRKRTRNKQD